MHARHDSARHFGARTALVPAPTRVQGERRYASRPSRRKPVRPLRAARRRAARRPSRSPTTITHGEPDAAADDALRAHESSRVWTTRYQPTTNASVHVDRARARKRAALPSRCSTPIAAKPAAPSPRSIGVAIYRDRRRAPALRRMRTSGHAPRHARSGQRADGPGDDAQAALEHSARAIEHELEGARVQARDPLLERARKCIAEPATAPERRALERAIEVAGQAGRERRRSRAHAEAPRRTRTRRARSPRRRAGRRWRRAGRCRALSKRSISGSNR